MKREFTKRVYEEFFRYHDFDNWLNNEETLTDVDIIILEKLTDIDVSADMVGNISVYENVKVKYLIKAGTANITYIVKIQCTTTNNQKFEDQIELKVI
jgi:hypothetical protein